MSLHNFHIRSLGIKRCARCVRRDLLLVVGEEEDEGDLLQIVNTFAYGEARVCL